MSRDTGSRRSSAFDMERSVKCLVEMAEGLLEAEAEEEWAAAKPGLAENVFALRAVIESRTAEGNRARKKPARNVVHK